jgi:acyl-CoA thioester hydrolase
MLSNDFRSLGVFAGFGPCLGIELIIMMKLEITPRFNDTDALGHINNAAIATWFEEARREIFKFFIPDLDPKKWNLILARIEIDYLRQSYYQRSVVIETEFEKIGNSSMTIIQRALQDGEVMSVGKSIMVHFDYSSNTSSKIPDQIREKMIDHLIEDE